MKRVYLITRLSSLLPKQAENSHKMCGCLLEDDRLAEVHIDGEGSSLLGNIYVGKVKNVLKNIDAAFVEIAGGQICFLPLTEAKHPVLTNRKPDGRLLAGDELLVQVKQDAVKTKDPVLTAAICVTGKYSNAALDGGHGIRYSHKLSDEAKKRCQAALKELVIPEGMTLIVRTAAEELQPDGKAGTSIDAVTAEAQELIERMQKLLCIGRTRTVFSLLTEDMPAWLKTFEKTCSALPDKVITDDLSVYTSMQAYLRERGNDLPQPEFLSFYQDEKVSLGQLYGLRSKISEALSKQVWLKSGGYLVIEPTEALTVIDVNTGKYTGKKSTEETFFLMNQEAAQETARQLRLRNLSGIILVDFINLKSRKLQEELLACLREACSRDSVPVRVVDITALGLVEITRKKVSRPLAEQWKGAPCDF